MNMITSGITDLPLLTHSLKIMIIMFQSFYHLAYTDDMFLIATDHKEHCLLPTKLERQRAKGYVFP